MYPQIPRQMIDEAEGATGGGLLFHFRRPNGRNMSRIDHIEEKPTEN